MRYKKISNHPKEISTLCLGTMTFGIQNDKKESFELLQYAVDNGINYIDTAELYPVPALDIASLHLTENYIGAWWANAGLNRDNITFVSKVMGPMGGRSTQARPQQNPLSPETINTAIDGTLKRLQLDCLDIYLVHWPLRTSNFFGTLSYPCAEESFDVNAQMLQVIETMDTLIKQGKILNYGLSNETAWGMMKYVQLAEQHNLAKPVTVQNPYSLLNRSYEVGCAEVSHRENIGLMAYAVTANGSLTGKHLKGIAPNSRMHKWPEYFSRYDNPQAHKAVQAYVDLAQDMGISPTTLAVAFTLQQPFMDCAIIGATHTAQVQDWIDAWDVVLNADIIKRIKDIHAIYTYPCP